MTNSQKIQPDASFPKAAKIKDDMKCEQRHPSRDVHRNGDAKHLLWDAGDEAEDVAEEIRPPDGGWGWMVVLGSFIIMVSNKKT